MERAVAAGELAHLLDFVAGLHDLVAAACFLRQFVEAPGVHAGQRVGVADHLALPYAGKFTE